MTNIFKNIGHGLEWFGKHVEELFVEFPKKLGTLITLSDDAKVIASDAANEVITLSTDVVALVAAIAKDDGASLKAIEALVAAAVAAGADKLANFTEDAAVVAAVSDFFHTLNSANYTDVLKGIAKIVADGKSLSQVVIADFEKLKADA